VRELPVGSAAVLVVVPLRAERLLGALLVGCGPDPAPAVGEITNDVAEVLTVAMRQARLSAEVADHTRNLERLVSERTAALQATVRELEAFGYTVAHDLRAPLRAMQGFATALEEDHAAKLDDAGRSHLARIRAASVRMDLLIRDLLDYTALVIEPLPPIEIDLGSVVAAALGPLAPAVAAREATVTVREPLGKVLAHPPTLTRMITNLVDNALKFVAEGVRPEVTLSAEIGESTVRLRVDDNGIGIDPRHHARIFNVFEQLDRTRPSGTGIGLAIVKKGAERMRGASGVEGLPTGGTRFWVELPRCG
jgi:signal transduction histidine kinase